MNLTANQAIALLSQPQYQTPDGLLDLVRQISIETPADKSGVPTLLYSGNMTPESTGPHTKIIAEHIKANYANKIRVIDSTEVAKFLSSEPFENTLKKIFSDNQAARDAWLYDATKGPWAIASEAFVRAAQGPIEVMAPFASANRTFALVEIPIAINTKEISTIAGLKRQDLVDFRDSLIKKGLPASEATLKSPILPPCMRVLLRKICKLPSKPKRLPQVADPLQKSLG